MRCTRLQTMAAIAFLSGAPASAQPLESPHDLWEHMIAAKGGHERLQSVRTFAWTATSVDPSHRNWATSDSIIGVAALPDHLWLREYSSVTTWRGRGLSSRPSVNDTTITSLEAWQLACFLETSTLRPTPVGVEAATDDARMVILEATSEHVNIRYAVDLESYTVRRVTLRPRTNDRDSRFTRFIDVRPYTFEGTESVDGVQMPRWIRTGDNVRDLRFLINPELDAALFEPWGDRPVSPDAWGAFLLADLQAAKKLAGLRPGPAPAVPLLMAGGGYDGTLGASARAAVVYEHIYAEATGGRGGIRATAGVMDLVAGFLPMGIFGLSAGATVTRTSGSPRETSPHSTYVGGQTGILAFGVKVDLGFDVRVDGGEPRAPHAAGFRWSVGYQLPVFGF